MADRREVYGIADAGRSLRLGRHPGCRQRMAGSDLLHRLHAERLFGLRVLKLRNRPVSVFYVYVKSHQNLRFSFQIRGEPLLRQPRHQAAADPGQPGQMYRAVRSSRDGLRNELLVRAYVPGHAGSGQRSVGLYYVS